MQIHEVCNDSTEQKNAYCADELLGEKMVVLFSDIRQISMA